MDARKIPYWTARRFTPSDKIAPPKPSERGVHWFIIDFSEPPSGYYDDDPAKP